MGNLDCPLWIWVVICHKKQLGRNEWLLVVISNTVLRTLQKSEGNCGGCWSFCRYHYTCWHFSPASSLLRRCLLRQTTPKNMIWKHIYHPDLTEYKVSFFLSLESFSKTSNEISKAVAGNENPVFEDLFLNVVLLFFFLRGRRRVAFFTVLARFHSCFHIFIMVPLLDSPKLWDFLQLTSKNMICCKLLDLGFESMH